MYIAGRKNSQIIFASAACGELDPEIDEVAYVTRWRTEAVSRRVVACHSELSTNYGDIMSEEQECSTVNRAAMHLDLLRHHA
jgi:hypothetical protein